MYVTLHICPPTNSTVWDGESANKEGLYNQAWASKVPEYVLSNVFDMPGVINLVPDNNVVKFLGLPGLYQYVAKLSGNVSRRGRVQVLNTSTPSVVSL